MAVVQLVSAFAFVSGFVEVAAVAFVVVVVVAAAFVTTTFDSVAAQSIAIGTCQPSVQIGVVQLAQVLPVSFYPAEESVDGFADAV